jgi:hypothetical protein
MDCKTWFQMLGREQNAYITLFPSLFDSVENQRLNKNIKHVKREKRRDREEKVGE